MENALSASAEDQISEVHAHSAVSLWQVVWKYVVSLLQVGSETPKRHQFPPRSNNRTQPFRYRRLPDVGERPISAALISSPRSAF
jgi:hypothetical protein